MGFWLIKCIQVLWGKSIHEHSLHSNKVYEFGDNNWVCCLFQEKGCFHDLFTVACIIDLRTQKKIVFRKYLSGVFNHLMIMSLLFFFFCLVLYKKLQVKYQGGNSEKMPLSRSSMWGFWENLDGLLWSSSLLTLCFVGFLVQLVSHLDAIIILVVLSITERGKHIKLRFTL